MVVNMLLEEKDYNTVDKLPDLQPKLTDPKVVSGWGT